MSEPTYDLNWKGDHVVQVTEDQLMEILPEFALVAEGESKKELKKGHGVETGTLRRSIHAAEEGYEFGGDNVEPSESSPERGNQSVKATKDGNRISCLLGSGMLYALKIHQGWGNFAGYHYFTNGIEKALEKLDAIIARHPVKE